MLVIIFFKDNSDRRTFVLNFDASDLYYVHIAGPLYTYIRCKIKRMKLESNI